MNCADDGINCEERLRLEAEIERLREELKASEAERCKMADTALAETDRLRSFDKRKRELAVLRRHLPYGEMCRSPELCAGKGYCPRDPTCGD